MIKEDRCLRLTLRSFSDQSCNVTQTQINAVFAGWWPVFQWQRCRLL